VRERETRLEREMREGGMRERGKRDERERRPLLFVLLILRAVFSLEQPAVLLV